MEEFFFSAKDEKVDNVHPKFHIILVIIDLLVGLAIKDGEKNESNF